MKNIHASTHKLQIGVGRYCNSTIPRDERYCINCHTVVEDDTCMLNQQDTFVTPCVMYLALKINVISKYMSILYKCLAQNVYIKSNLQKVHTFIFLLRSTISDTCLRQG